jgi:hypothetical protein
MGERIKWLDNFNAAMSLARFAAASVDHNGVILSLSGNVVMGDRLQEVAATLKEALTSVDGAISQMISDDVADSFRRTDKTFKAVLTTLLTTTTKEHEG